MFGLKRAQTAVDDARRTVSTAAVISVAALVIAVVALAVAAQKGK